MTHAGYRQLASRADLSAEIRVGALGAFINAHQLALGRLQACAFSKAEMGGMQRAAAPAVGDEFDGLTFRHAGRAVTDPAHERVMRGLADALSNQDWDRLTDVFHDAVLELRSRPEDNPACSETRFLRSFKWPDRNEDALSHGDRAWPVRHAARASAMHHAG